MPMIFPFKISAKWRIRAGLWGLLALAVIAILWSNIVPGGQAVYRIDDLSAWNYRLTSPGPADRVGSVEDEGTEFLRVKGDPVYFNLRPPRRFEQATIRLEYRREGAALASSAPIVEAGVLADKDAWRYRTAPLENRVLDRLADSGWSVVPGEGGVLYQSTSTYGSIAEFLASPTPTTEIALYNYRLDLPFALPGYRPDGTVYIFTPGLTGGYEYLIYLADEELGQELHFTDLNLRPGPDPVKVNVYYRQELIDSRELPDDGDTEASGLAGQPRMLEIRTGRMPAGVYTVEVKAGGDIVTGEIATRQSRFVMNGKFTIGEPVADRMSLVTDSRRATFLITDPAARQTVQAGTSTLRLEKTYQPYEMAMNGISRVDLERRGVTISGDGVWSFGPGHFFSPKIRTVGPDLDPAETGTRYILAVYRPPLSADGWTVAEADLDLTSAYREDGAYGLMLSVPGLKADDAIEDSLLVRSIEVRLRGKSLWTKIKEILRY